MLELTRRIGQGVRIAHTITLTVVNLAPGTASLLFEGPLVSTVMMSRGTAYEFEVNGDNVRLHLISVIRGEARLGFEAPRRIDIQRIERDGS